MTDRPKETVYDEQIAPLMSQVIALCKEHHINAAMQFSLDYNEETDSPLMCTTVLAIDKEDQQGHEMMRKLREVMRPETHFFTMTVTEASDR